MGIGLWRFLYRALPMTPMIPPNLVDGQHWLPSEIIPDIFGFLSPTHNPQPVNPPFPKGPVPATGFEAAGNGFGPTSGFWIPQGIGAYFPVSGIRPVQRQGPGRFTPIRVNGSVRETGGTGVFLPTMTYNEVKWMAYNEVKWKPRVRMNGNGGARQQKQQQAIKKKQQQQQQQQEVKAKPIQASSPEAILPQEWTY